MAVSRALRSRLGAFGLVSFDHARIERNSGGGDLESAIAAVFEVLFPNIDGGQVEKIVGILPKPIGDM